jgi:DNA-binding NarL/FixJ family response regulator
VKTYSSRIYGKLHVNNRSQALMTALSRGLLTVDADAA